MSRRDTSGTRRGRGGLSQEDADVWDLVSQAYEPLRPRLKPRVHPADGRAEAGTGQPPSPSGVPAAHARHAAGHAAPHFPHPKPQTDPIVPARAPPLGEFDRKKAKRLAAGRLAIDARIDLHGMRQSEAHMALRAFLLACYGRGRRHVLVITGKGAPSRADGESHDSFMDTRERGVLRRNVPHWLADPELRPIVVSYREAAQPHGGSGALYVHLRARHKLDE